MKQTNRIARITIGDSADGERTATSSVLCRSLCRRPWPRRPGDLEVRRRRRRRRGGNFLERRAEAGRGQRGEPRQLGHHDGQGIQLRPVRQAPRGQRHLELHADERPHRAVRHQRVGRLGADHLRQQRIQAGQGVEDTGREGLQGRARPHRRPRRHARRLRRRESARRLGNARHGAALPRRAAQRLPRHAPHLPAGRLVERRRRHRRARSGQDDGRPSRKDGGARAELAVALLHPERADQRGRAAGGSPVQVHAGRLPGGRRLQRRQEPRRRRQLGAGHLQPGEGPWQPDDGHDRDRQQADCRRLVLARRLRERQPGHHGRPGPRHLRRDAGPEGAGRQAERRQADGRRLLDSRKRCARHARRRALYELRREPRVLPEPEQSDELRAHRGTRRTSSTRRSARSPSRRRSIRSWTSR